MKEIKLGESTYKIVSDIGEIRYDKMVMFQQYITAIFQGLDMPLFALTMDKVRVHFNNGDYMQAYSELTNFDTAIKLKQINIDPLGMCFAIMLEGNEANEDVLQEKLNKMIDDGLAWDTVKEEVLNFMKLYPSKYSPYLQAWEMMGQGIGL